MKKTLLVIHSSGRVTRSITRQLADRFVNAWQQENPETEVLVRDVGLNPPPTVNEAWIATAYGGAEAPAKGSPHPLAASDTYIDEIKRADVIVIGAPMYNFGMPAQLKAYIDQIVRVGQTFEFIPGPQQSYRPLLPATKRVVIMVSLGDGSLLPGGPLEHMNFLEPHLATVLGLIGLTDVTFIRSGYEEYQDDRARLSREAAEHAAEETATRLARQLN